MEWPATPDLAAAVSTRIAARAGSRAPAPTAPGAAGARGSRYVAAALVAARRRHARRLARGALDRAALARDRERRDPARASRGRAPGATLNLGTPITLDALRHARCPRRSSARPSGLRDARCPTARARASLVYAGPRVLVQTFRARVTPFIEKTVGSARRRRAPDGRRRARVLDHGLARVRVPRPGTASATRTSGSRTATLLVERGRACCCGSRARSAATAPSRSPAQFSDGSGGIVASSA